MYLLPKKNKSKNNTQQYTLNSELKENIVKQI